MRSKPHVSGISCSLTFKDDQIHASGQRLGSAPAYIKIGSRRTAREEQGFWKGQLKAARSIGFGDSQSPRFRLVYTSQSAALFDLAFNSLGKLPLLPRTQLFSGLITTLPKSSFVSYQHLLTGSVAPTLDLPFPPLPPHPSLPDGSIQSHVYSLKSPILTPPSRNLHLDLITDQTNTGNRESHPEIVE